MEDKLMKTKHFKDNFAMNNKTNTATAISFLESDLFRASLIACNQFRIISNRKRGENENAGAEFFNWIYNNIIIDEKNHALAKKLRLLIFCGNEDRAIESLKAENMSVGKDVFKG